MTLEIRVHRCRSFWARLRGLVGKPAPPAGEATWIVPCKQVHTAFMTYPIDVVHLDAAGAVLACETLRPWRIGKKVRRGHSILELRQGEAARLGLAPEVKPRLIVIHSSAT